MKKINYLILISTIILAQWSCNDFLDTVPDNRTEIDSQDKLAKLITSAYPKGGYAMLFNARIDYVSDKGLGSFTEYIPNSDSFFWRDVESVAQDTPTYLWNKCYYAIAVANHAIRAAENIEGDLVEQYVAEAKLARAFSHFILVTSFAKMYDPLGTNDSPGIPYVYDPETVVIKQYERGTVASVYAKIEQDLKEGLAALGSDAKYDVPRYHFNIAAANAFAARFYTFKREPEEVIKYASNVIPNPTQFTGSGNTLNVSAADAATVFAVNNFQPWLTSIATAIGSDVIKTIYSKSDNASNLLLCEQISRLASYTSSLRYTLDEDDKSALLQATNPAKGSWAYRVYGSVPSYYVPKFHKHFVYTSLNGSTGYNYVMFPFLRTEEVLLNRAEAYVLTDQPEKAVADLNIFFRQRTKSYDEAKHAVSVSSIAAFYKERTSNPDNFFHTYNAYGSASWTEEKMALILCIMECKSVEFIHEGLRYWDMWRYRIPIIHTNYLGVTNTLYPDDDRWMLQLPETVTTSGIELNPRENLLSPAW